VAYFLPDDLRFAQRSQVDAHAFRRTTSQPNTGVFPDMSKAGNGSLEDWQSEALAITPVYIKLL
jgi:hypothetical protein